MACPKFHVELFETVKINEREFRSSVDHRTHTLNVRADSTLRQGIEIGILVGYAAACRDLLGVAAIYDANDGEVPDVN